MTDDVLILDDIIDIETQDAIEKICLSDSFGWIFNPTTAYSKEDLDQYNLPASFFKDSIDSPYFTHTLWNEYGRNSYLFNHFIPLLDVIPVNINRIIRFKINLTLPLAKPGPDTRSIPHVDYVANPEDKITTCIYYINDSDGDTFIFNEPFEHKGELTIKQRITPKRGRLVLFDSSLLHSGNNPRDNNCRITANLNLLLNR